MANVFPIILNGNQKRVYNPSSDLIPFLNYLNVVDQKAQDVDGGTFTSGAWRTRDLNTVRVNQIIGASLASNLVNLPIGKYFAQWDCPYYDTAGARSHQSRLFNVTENTLLLLGSTESTDAQDTSRSIGHGYFELLSTSDISVQHRCTKSQTGNGFGNGANIGPEIYTQLSIWKVG